MVRKVYTQEASQERKKSWRAMYYTSNSLPNGLAPSTLLRPQPWPVLHPSRSRVKPQAEDRQRPLITIRT